MFFYAFIKQVKQFSRSFGLKVKAHITTLLKGYFILFEATYGWLKFYILSVDNIFIIYYVPFWQNKLFLFYIYGANNLLN